MRNTFRTNIEQKWENKGYCILCHIFCNLKLGNIRSANEMYKAYSKQVNETKNLHKEGKDVLNLVDDSIKSELNKRTFQNVLSSEKVKKFGDVSVITS